MVKSTVLTLIYKIEKWDLHSSKISKSAYYTYLFFRHHSTFLLLLFVSSFRETFITSNNRSYRTMHAGRKCTMETGMGLPVDLLIRRRWSFFGKTKSCVELSFFVVKQSLFLTVIINLSCLSITKRVDKYRHSEWTCSTMGPKWKRKNAKNTYMIFYF